MSRLAGSVPGGGSTLSGSMWVRPRELSGFSSDLYDLISWSLPADYPDGFTYSSISLKGDGSGLVFTLTGPPVPYSDSYFLWPIFVSGARNSWADGATAYSFINNISPTGFGSPACFGLAAQAIFGVGQPRMSPITVNKWFHLFFSFDFSPDDTITFGGPDTTVTTNKFVNIFVNGVDVFHDVGETTFSNTSILMVMNDVFDEVSGETGTTATLPGFSLFGGQYGIPTIPNFIDSLNWGSGVQPSMDRAYTQLWFGHYIEPTSVNIRKFLNIGATKITPRDNGSIAAAAFGIPDLWFYRDKKSNVNFQTNHGTAGVPTISGTALADISGPSVP